MSELKPCPFCGSAPTMVTDAIEEGDIYNDCQVICRECGASGEFEKDTSVSIAAWNRRAAPSETENVAEARKLLVWEGLRIDAETTGKAIAAALRSRDERHAQEIAEKDAEIARLRAVVEAARKVHSEFYNNSIIDLRAALAALDAAEEGR